MKFAYERLSPCCPDCGRTFRPRGTPTIRFIEVKCGECRQSYVARFWQRQGSPVPEYRAGAELAGMAYLSAVLRGDVEIPDA